MALSSELLSQLVKVAKPVEQKPTEATVYGTIVEQNDDLYVQIDGSDVITPAKSTVRMKSGDRVIVRIKDHSAVVTGNLTNKSASSGEVDDLVNEITEVEILVADKVSVGELDAVYARIDEIDAGSITTEELDAEIARIEELVAGSITTDELDAEVARIENLIATKLDAEIADITYATITELEAVEAEIYNLDATYATIESLEATNARIDVLDATTITAEEADLRYADIEFANIGDAAIENFFAKSGMVEDLVVSEGRITGTLTSVEINADYISTGTLKAERLVLLGEDGLFHEINVQAGQVTEGEAVPDDSIHGSVITAKSITATQIYVDDLIAFDATIGGFNIGTNSLYSGVKESIDNSTRGIYMDTEGQMYIGDADNFLRYRRIAIENPVELTLTSSKVITATNAVVGDISNSGFVVSDLVDVTDCSTVVISAWACANRYAYVFRDADGAFVEGLTIADTYAEAVGIERQVVAVPEGAATLQIAGFTGKVSPALAKVNTDKFRLEISAESILFGADAKSSVADLQTLTEHVKIGTYYDSETDDNKPCIELAEGDSDFKQVITNTKTMFMNGSAVGTEINTDGVETDNLTIKNEFRHGDWLWARRANGNYGLIWKGATG